MYLRSRGEVLVSLIRQRDQRPGVADDQRSLPNPRASTESTYSGVEPCFGPSLIMPTNLGGQVRAVKRLASSSNAATWSSGIPAIRWTNSSRRAVMGTSVSRRTRCLPQPERTRSGRPSASRSRARPRFGTRSARRCVVVANRQDHRHQRGGRPSALRRSRSVLTGGRDIATAIVFQHHSPPEIRDASDGCEPVPPDRYGPDYEFVASVSSISFKACSHASIPGACGLTHQPTTPAASLATPQEPFGSAGRITIEGTPTMVLGSI